MKSVVKRIFSLLLIACVTLTVAFGDIAAVGAAPAASTAAAKDIKGSIAEAQITEWIKKGIAPVYSDKTFRPNRNITRIELITIVNRAFGFKSTSYIDFNDVSSGTATATEVAKAISAGYIKAFSNGTFRPNNAVTRQEMAEIVCKLLKLSVTKNTATLNKVKDLKSVSSSSAGYVSTVLQNGYFSLYTGNLFKPTKALTRAEAVSLLYRAAGTVFNKYGSYDYANKAIKGNVTITTTGVSLSNTVINGNLYLCESMAEGGATLSNVTVKGKTYISGGGHDGIFLRNTTFGNTYLYKKTGSVGVSATGSTKIGNLLVNSPCILSESSLTGKGFTNLTADIKSSAEKSLLLTGSFDNVTINSSYTETAISQGYITNLSTGKNASGSTITIDSPAGARTVLLNSAAAVKGTGSVRTVDIRAAGVTVEQTPVYAILKKGLTATVGGDLIRESTTYLPTITSASLDLATGKLVITGKNLLSVAGANNDITASKLSFSRGALGGSRTLSTTANADISSPTTAVLTVSGSDLTTIKSWMNGTTSKTFSLVASSGWNGSTAPPDFTGNPVVVTGSFEPSLTSATLNLSNGQLVLTGAYLASVPGSANDITASKLTISDGNGGHSKTLMYTANSDISSTSSAVLTLSATDLSAIKAWAVQNGVSLNGNSYNIAAAAGWNGSSSPADLTGNQVTVSGNPLPVITSAALNTSNGQLAIYGTNLISISGSANDITASKLTISDGSGGHSRTLSTSGSADITSSTTAFITVSGDDLTALRGWAVQSGTSLNGYAYNLSASAGWNGPDSLSDLTGNPVTVSGGNTPTITSAAMDIHTGQLVLYGSDFNSISGPGNDILSSLLTVSDGNGGHSRTLSYTANVDIYSTSTVSITVSSTDLSYISSWATQNGTSVNGYSYYLHAAAGWNGTNSLADTQNTLTISGNSTASLSSATLNIASGQLTLYGSNFNSFSGSYNDIYAAYIYISDSTGGHSRQLSATGNVDIYNSSTAYLTLQGTDLSSIREWATQDGTSRGGYAYNISVYTGWNGSGSTTDISNPLTVTGNSSPTLISATLNVTSGQLTLNGSSFNSFSGSYNDIYAAYIYISDGAGGHSRQLSTTGNVDIYNSSTAYLTLQGADLSSIREWATQNGTSHNGYAYNISVSAGWNGSGSASDSSNPLTVSGNSSLSAITSATLDVSRGMLVITGTNLVSVAGSSNDITAAKITLSDGAGGHSRTLSSTANADISSPTIAVLSLSDDDRTAVAGWATQNGTTRNGYAYNISAAAGWNGINSVPDQTGNPVTVSGNALPVLNSAAFNVITGQLVLSGTNLASILGSSNDITASKLTISDGAGGHSSTLSTTGNVDITSSTSATLTLSRADLTILAAWVKQNGISLNGNPYNIAADNGWNGIDSGADPTGNPVTVIGNPLPELTSATLDVSSGVLVLTGTNLIAVGGTANDISATKITISDSTGGHSYTLTSLTSNVDISNPTTAVLTLRGTDLSSIAAWATGNGTSVNGHPYNISVAAEWNGPTSKADTGNSLTVSGASTLAPPLVTAPTLVKNGNANQTVILLAPLGAGNTYRYILSSNANPVSTPAVGFNAASWTPVTNGSVISAENGRNIGVAEVDAGNLVVRFTNVTAVSDYAAPALTTLPIFTDALGADKNGKTVITLGAPSAAGNTFKYIVSTNASPVPAPVAGADTSGWTAVVSGNEIAAAHGTHIGVAEVDPAGHVVRFSDATAVALNYIVPTPAQKTADASLGNPVNFSAIIANAGGTKLKLVLNGTNVALNAVEALGNAYPASTNITFVAAALQTDINNAFGAGNFIVSSNGTKLVITSTLTGSAAIINLSGSDSAIAAALGFANLAEVRGTDGRN